MTRKINTRYTKNKRMDSATYQQRRAVMAIVYEARELLGGKFSRVEVRIAERLHDGILGVARLDIQAIFIPENAFDMSELQFRHIVMHELCHTLAGVGHDEDCPLMASVLKPSTKEEQNQAFLKYF